MTDWLDTLQALIADEPTEAAALAAALSRGEELNAAPVSDEQAQEALALLERHVAAHPEASVARYLRAQLQVRVGEPTAARSFARVAERWAQTRQWAAACRAARRAVELPASEAYLPLLLRLSRAAGDPEALAQDVAWAAELAPGAPAVLLARAQLAQDAGDLGGAAALARRALRGYVEQAQASGAEEALLLALEATDRAALEEMLRQVPQMARHGLAALADSALDLLAEPAVDHGLARRLVQATEQALLKGADSAAMRRHYLLAQAALRGGSAGVEAVARESGFSDPQRPLAEALEAFRRALRLAPGALLKHQGWGLGQVASAAGEALVMDFPGRPGHRMARGMAAQSLLPVEPDSLEAQLHLHSEKLAEEARQDPVALLLRAVDEQGAEASATQIKQALAGTAIPAEQWSAWWKQARSAAAADPRLDHTQAFEGRYRRAAPGAGGQVELPPLRRQEGLAAAVKLVRSLLAQHPELTDSAREQYGTVLAEWVRQAGSSEAAAAAALLLAPWYPQERARWAKLVADAVRTAGSLNLLSSAADQQAALELVAEAPDSTSLLICALGSRHAAVRRRATQLLQARPAELPTALRSALLSVDTPAATAVAAVELALADAPTLAEPHSPWALVLALLRVLGEARAQRDLKAAADLLDPQGPLAERLSEAACPGELEIPVEEALGHLAQRPQGAALARELLTAAGHEAYLRYLERAPQPPVGGLPPEQDPQVILLSRHTHAQKAARLEQLERELATEIPRLIAAARELGDLSENADYHAARERQGLAAAEVRALQALLECARLIEDLEWTEGRIAPGTEVTLRELDTDRERTLWILGVDDTHHGPEVVSYRADLGQALMGHATGDRVTVSSGGTPVTHEVVRVVRRLPDE